ncbi:putative reverse transcriptase domain-containing protein [Tanacetum coccineum]
MIDDYAALPSFRHCQGVTDWLSEPSAGQSITESRGGGTGGRVGRSGGRGRGPREGNDERVDELNGQGNNQGLGANGGVEGVNRNVEGVNGGVGGAPDFSTIIAQQLQNLLPAMLAQVGNQGNVGNQNGNVVNENEYDGKGGVVVLTRWIEKMESVQDMSGCSIDQKVKYTAGSFVVYDDRVVLSLVMEMQKLETVCGIMSWKMRIWVLGQSVPPATSTMHLEGLVALASTARGRAFMLAVEEARQDPNIMTGIEPIKLGFRYEIEIASGQLVEIDKVIKGCKLEIKGHVFDIDLIPFGHGSFDVIIGMDCLSNHKAKIICHEKVVRISLLDSKVLRVLGEKPEEKMRQLKSAKVKEKEQE